MYVDVFYVTIFSRVISMLFCVYMMVMIFKPHHFFDSHKMQVVSKTCELIFTTFMNHDCQA